MVRIENTLTDQAVEIMKMRTVINPHIVCSLVIVVLCITTINVTATGHPKGNETIIIAGAGPSTTIVQKFFSVLANNPKANHLNFVVPSRSIKHAGGIKSADTNLFGRTGRPMTPEELGTTRKEIFLAGIPLTFVADPDLIIPELTIEDLTGIFTKQIRNWKDLGGPDQPIKLVGREPSEAAFRELQKFIPEMKEAEFDIVLKKDHQVVQLLKSSDRTGYLGFGAKPNFMDQYHLSVPELTAKLDVGLVYRSDNVNNPIVKLVLDNTVSQEWKKVVLEMGLIPIKQ